MRMKSATSVSLAIISGRDVLALEDQNSGQQQRCRVRAADAGVMFEARPRDVGLEHVAPAVHIGREEVRAQVLEELYAPDDVEREIERERGDDGESGRVEDDRTQQ